MAVFLGVLIPVLCGIFFSTGGIGVAALHVWDGVRVEITCTGIEASRPTWDINGDVIDPGNAAQFLDDGIESKDGWNGEWLNTLCIDVELKQQNYTLECRIGVTTLYYTTLVIHAQFPPPDNVRMSHTSSGVHFELSPPSFDVDPNENVIIKVFPNITHYTVYIGNRNTGNVTEYRTRDNSTEFTLTGLPGEDLNECTEYVFEVAAVSARAGEGIRSEPQHIFIPRDCNTFTSESSSISTPAPTATPCPIAKEKFKHWKAVAIAGLSATGVMFVILLLWMVLFCTLRTHKRAGADHIDLNRNSAYGSAKPRAMAQRSSIATPTVPPVYEELSGVQ